MADIREFNVAEATDLALSSRSTGAVLVNPPPPQELHMMAQFGTEIDTSTPSAKWKQILNVDQLHQWDIKHQMVLVTN